MEKNIYCGRGNAVPYEELMSVLNTSFGFFTPETEFFINPTGRHFNIKFYVL